MPYEMNANDRRLLLANKASILGEIAARGGYPHGALTKEFALEMISVLTELANELPPRPPKSEEVSKAA